MRSFFGTGDLPVFRAPVVTVGSFDGVHRGHRSLLDATVNAAKDKGVDSVAVTFSPHPRKVLKPDVKTELLSPTEEKLYLLGLSGIDFTVVIPFDEHFARMDSGAFIREIIRGDLRASSMVVGYDHRFGHNKQGDYGQLKDAGLEIVRIPELKENNLKISSTEVRRAVAEGDMATASGILGHPYIIMGSIEDGMMRLPDADKLLPKEGSYKVRVMPDTGRATGALLNILPGGGLKLDVETALREGERVIISFL